MPSPNVDTSKLAVGSFFYRVVHYRVTSIDERSVHTVSDTAGASTISKSLVENSAYATDQYAEEVRLTRTELAQKIEGLGHACFRVTYKKKVDANHVADGLEGKDLSSTTKRRRLLKTLMEGEERVMHAKLHRSEEFDAAMELGRYKVIDLEAFEDNGYDEKKAMRLIDTRTISELVVDNVRYHI